MTNGTLTELAIGLVDVEVDGERVENLEPKNISTKPRYETADSIAKEAGISPDSPRYSGLHHHCQYSRNG